MTDLQLVAGFGNPGTRYRGSYHNIGFRAVDVLLDEYETRALDASPGALFNVTDGPVSHLGKPDRYVNRSGSALAAWCDRFGWSPGQCLVIYDDFSLEVGEVRIRPSGSAGGHRGMADVIETLGTDEIPRLRIGIGPLPDHISAEDYVLGSVREEHQPVLEAVVDQTPAMVASVVKDDVETAMSRWNGHRFEAGV